MTRYMLASSYSLVKSITVQAPIPAPVITTVAWPGSPKSQGTSCKTNISFRNDGGDGDIFLRVVDSFGSVLESVIRSVAAGETGTISLYFNMPVSDIIIYAQVGVGIAVTDTKGPYTVEVLLTIKTSLSLTLSPTKVDPGKTVNFSGQLTRADANPTDIQTIKVRDDVSGALIATVSTNNVGNYSGSFTAPTKIGTFYYVSEFAGASIAMITLAPSFSNAKTVSVETMLTIAIKMLGPITVAAILLYQK